MNYSKPQEKMNAFRESMQSEQRRIGQLSLEEIELEETILQNQLSVIDIQLDALKAKCENDEDLFDDELKWRTKALTAKNYMQTSLKLLTNAKTKLLREGQRNGVNFEKTFFDCARSTLPEELFQAVYAKANQAVMTQLGIAV